MTEQELLFNLIKKLDSGEIKFCSDSKGDSFWLSFGDKFSERVYLTADDRQQNQEFKDKFYQNKETKTEKIDYDYRRKLGYKCCKCEVSLLQGCKSFFNWLKNTITNKDEGFCDACFKKLKKDRNYLEYK